MTAAWPRVDKGGGSARTLADGQDGTRRALVVFSGQADLAWLRMLRPGYRHCFALVQSGDHWVLYNPLSNGTEIEVWPGGQEQSIRAWLVQNGYEVIDETVRPLRPPALAWSPFTCVESVKRVLGLRAPGIFTPWQLYRRLKRTNRKKILDIRGLLGYKSF